MKSEFEILGDGRTVWVNASDGSSVARFGRMGIDVHTTISEQIAGAGQCLACTHGKTVLADWLRFKELLMQHYGIEIDDSLMPKHLTEK